MKMFNKSILAFIFLISTMIIPSAVFAFNKDHNKSEDAGINFQVEVRHFGICHGSLLSRTIVISAKHCMRSNNDVKPLVFYNKIEYKVKKVHEFEPKGLSTSKDVMILELASPVKGNNIKFVKLPTKRQEAEAFAKYSPLTLFGYWGSPWDGINGYANKYLSDGNPDHPETDILPKLNCPEGPGDKTYFCTYKPSKYYTYSVINGDSGGAVTFKKDGEYYILGVISSRNYYPRFNGDIRKWINGLFVELHHWNDSARKGYIGAIYAYDNPHSNLIEYFGLNRLGTDGKYWYFPTDRTNNNYWVYLGNDNQYNARIRFDQILDLNRWSDNGRRGKIGDDYVYVNPYTRDIEIFTLKALGSDHKYWYFPTHKNDNKFWTYKGLFKLN